MIPKIDFIILIIIIVCLEIFIVWRDRQDKHNIINPNFKHGRNFEIGYYNLIHNDVTVGDNVKIKSFVELRPNTVIEDDCYIDSGVKSSGNNFIGSGVTIRYGAKIAKNVIIDEGAFIAPEVMFINIPFVDKNKEVTHVGKRVKIGALSVINDGVSIPDDTIIGALSFVRVSIKEKGVYVGNPLRRIR